MALNFPNSPTLNQVYTDATSGFSYQWNGTVWISFGAASSNQIKILDDISGSFTGIAFTFALTSSSISILPPNKQSLIINLGGVIQDPSDDYSVSGSNIIFSTAPNNGLSFSGVSLGPAIPINTIPDGTVTAGSLTVAGILSTTNLFVTGISTFVGLATHTGTIFGSNLSLTGVATASSFVGTLTGTATSTTNIPNLTGAITSVNTTTSLGSFSSSNLATALTDETGTGANVFATSPTLVTPSLGIATATSLNVSGVVTATTFVGALTGNATGLSGTPNITVGNIVGAALTLSGNLTVNGTQTIINTTNLEITDPLVGIGSGNTTDAQASGDGIQIYGATNKTLTYNDTKKAFETNVAWATTETRFISVAEKLTRVDGNTASLVYNGASSNIGLCTNPSGNITLAVTGIPTDSSFDNHSISFGVMVNQTGTARSCTAVTLNGYSATIRFAGGSLSAAISGVTTTSGMDIYNFTGINTVGSASTTANYYLLGVVNGGFR